MRSSSLTESHLLRVRVGFHSVALQAKFSCELVLELRVQGTGKVICETAGRPLKEGRCEVSQQLELQWLACYDVGRSAYTQTIMEITVLARSVHGSILAGIVTLDVTRRHEQTVLPLRKCSDKSSTLCLSAEHEFLQVVHEDREREDSRESRESPDLSHELKRMRSLSYIGKNQDSQLSISKIAVSNKRIEHYLRGQNEQLHRQIQINQSKLKVAEKKEKEALFQLREALIKCERLNNRTNELEKHQLTLEGALSESEKKLRMLQSELKRECSKTKEIQQNYCNLQKRGEAKQVALNEQLKKASEKGAALQLQLQQSTLAYSSLLLKYEQSQTNSQALSKEREKMAAGQRVKMSKEITEKEALLKDNQNQIQQLKEKVAELQFLQKNQRESSRFEDILGKKNEELDAVSTENASLKARIQDLQEEISQLRDSQEQRQPLRKRLNEVLLEKNNLQLQLDKMSKNYSTIEAKNKQLLQQVESSSSQIKQQGAKLKETISANTLLVSKRKELEKEIAHFRESQDRLAELLKLEKEKNEQRQSSFLKELEDEYRKGEVLQAEKAGVEQECNDLKWQIQKLETVNKDLQSSHAIIKAQLFEMKQQNMLQQEKFEHLQQENRALQGTIAAKEDEVRVQQAKNKELFKGVGDKVSVISQLQKERSSYINEKNELKEEVQGLRSQLEGFNQSEEKKRSHFLELKAQWQLQRGQLLEELSSKAEQLHHLKQELQKQSRNLKEIVEENESLSSENIQLTTELSHKEIEMKSLKQANLNKDQQFSAAKQLLSQRTEELEQLQCSFTHYKSTNSDAVRWVLCLLGSSELIVQSQTVFFPEENLRQLQVQAVKNRNLFLTKQREILQSIREQKQFITTQLEKIGQELLDCRGEFQQELERQLAEKDLEMKELIFEHSSIQSDLYECNSLRQQLKEENDNFFKQNKLMEHQLEESILEKAKMLEEKVELSSRLKESTKEGEDQKRKLIDLSHENKKLELRIFQISEQGRGEQANQLKNELECLAEKLQLRQTELAQKQEKIRSFQQKTLILQSEKRKIEFTYNVSQELFRQQEKQLEESNKAKAKISMENEHLHSQIEKKERLLSHKDAEYSHILSEKLTMEERVENMDATIIQLRNQLNEKEQAVHYKLQELKDLKNKNKENDENHHRLKESLQLSISELKGQLSICQLLADQSASQLSSKELQITGLREELEHKKEVISKIESDHEMAQKEVFFQQSHKNTLNREFEELSENYEHAKSEIYALQEEKLRLEKELQEAQEQLQRVQRNLEEALESSRVRVVREVGEFKKRAEQEQARAERQQAKCEELKTRVKQLQTALQKKEFLILSGEQERERLRCDYEEEIQRIGLQLQKMQEGHDQHFAEYKDEREQLLKQIEHLGQQCSQFNDIVRNLSDQLESSQKEQEKASRKIALLENEARMMSPQKDRSGKQRSESKGSPPINEFSYN